MALASNISKDVEGSLDDVQGIKRLFVAIILQSLKDFRGNNYKHRRTAVTFLRGEGFVTCMNALGWHNEKMIEELRVECLKNKGGGDDLLCRRSTF